MITENSTGRNMQNLMLRTQFLAQFVDEHKMGLILIPQYQRSGIWDAKRRQQWAETVRGEGIIPSFIVYKIGDAGNFYLCDGYQRLDTTLKMLDYPSEYGFISKEDVTSCLYKVIICVQQVDFDSEEEAYRWFILINNQGATLTPSELLKGELVNNNCPLGSYVFREAEQWIRPSLLRLCSGKKKGTDQRAEDNRQKRASLALFFQYISDYRGTEFWSYGRKQLKEWKPLVGLEAQLAEKLNTLTPTKLDEIVKNYVKYIEGYTSAIREFVDNIEDKRAISPGLFYHLMHFSIYAKNNKIQVKKVLEVMQFLIANAQSFTTRINFIKEGKAHGITLSADSLSNLWNLLILNGITVERPKREKKPALISGYEHSHLLPFSNFGEGATIAEPSVINRSRGANPIEDNAN